MGSHKKAKIQFIEKLSPPNLVNSVHYFLGYVGFYLCFIKDLSIITKPLCNLLVKDVHFIFSNEPLLAFNTLKKKVSTSTNCTRLELTICTKLELTL